jgi:heptosyltransferase-2
MAEERILVWLPSPLGDAVLSTPALRALRERYPQARISFVAGSATGEFLKGNPWCDEWIRLGRNPIRSAGQLHSGRFDRAILLKNSFGSAMTVWLARIPHRIGYDRDGRGILLTTRIRPSKSCDGRYLPESMIDYYLRIASELGAETQDRRMELFVEPGATATLLAKLPIVATPASPLVILVPGGSFGPSKCWPSGRFAALADELAGRFGARIVISVAPTEAEQRIARQIQSIAQTKLYSLADSPLTPAELKALIAEADLVIGNDTGPRHIAIALRRKLITLFGPNNPAWTQTGYSDEIPIIGQGRCVPCERPTCREKEHYCMESISVECVCHAAAKALEGWNR